MAKVWVLDTSTKGTGATMVPLESILRKPSGPSDPIYVPPPRPPKAPPPAEPRRPRRFKVVDIRSRELLAEDATARATIQVLNGVRSIIDVNVYVWVPATEQWRLLTFDEQRLLWSHRDQAPMTPHTVAAAQKAAAPSRASECSTPGVESVPPTPHDASADSRGRRKARAGPR